MTIFAEFDAPTRDEEISIADDLQWWFVCLYPRNPSDAESVVRELIPPVIAEARALGVVRWFYIRYFDSRGPHIRLRILGRRRALDRLQRYQKELVRQLRELEANSDEQAHIPAHAGWGVGESPEAHALAALYEPEYVKYGGRVGLDLAEEVFEFSSDLGVWCASVITQRTHRAALAALLLADSVEAMIQGTHSQLSDERRSATAQHFWDIHFQWWSGLRANPHATLPQRMQEHALDRVSSFHQLMTEVGAAPAVIAWRLRWQRTIDDYLYRAEQQGLDRTLQHLLFHQNHMMTNRIGFTPKEEALLGIYAADWVGEDKPAHAK